MTQGFVPPPYPYDRLDAFKPFANAFEGGAIDLSVGDPCDPPSAAVIAALSSSNLERGYPPSIGIEPLRSAVRSWMQRKFDIDIPLAQIAAAVGSKEFVVTTPQTIWKPLSIGAVHMACLCLVMSAMWNSRGKVNQAQHCNMAQRV